jgi:hypothetical protein
MQTVPWRTVPRYRLNSGRRASFSILAFVASASGSCPDQLQTSTAFELGDFVPSISFALEKRVAARRARSAQLFESNKKGRFVFPPPVSGCRRSDL